MKNGYDKDMLIVRALKYFIEEPYAEVYLREFAVKTGVSLNSAQRFLASFIKEGIIKDFRRGNLRYFKANLDSQYFKALKKVFEIRAIEHSGIIEEFNKAGAVNLVVFGSVAKGESDAGSDLDLLCIGVRGKVDLYPYMKKIKREINVQYFSFLEWKKQAVKNKAFYQEVIANGISLIGGMPIV